jgi:catechol 2,3-dioxygenase
LTRSIAYYMDVLGLDARERADGYATLGPHDDERVLVHLVERTGAVRADARPHTGLYHFAILVPDRATLGAFVRHLSQLGVRAGAGNHLVSEAFYLTDPDGLGIEVYADRPRETWRRQGRELMMATDPVDVHDLLRAAGDVAWQGMPAGTVIGHVHLHVGDIAGAAAFYGDALGFDRMVWSYPGALFFGADGYHHHVGTNTWAGPRATAPAADDAQLLSWTLELPDDAALATLATQVAASGADVTRTDDGFDTRDTWGTTVKVRTATM